MNSKVATRDNIAGFQSIPKNSHGPRVPSDRRLTSTKAGPLVTWPVQGACPSAIAVLGGREPISWGMTASDRAQLLRQEDAVAQNLGAATQQQSTRIRTGPWEPGTGSSAEKALARLSKRGRLVRGSDLEGRTAAAAAGDVRVAELETGAVNAVDEVDFGAVEVLEAQRVDVQLDPI